MRKVKAKIIANKEIALEHYKMTLASAYLARASKPGQFVHVRCSDSYAPLLRKPFGVHRTYKNGIDILYKVVGPGTKLLKEKKKGEMLDVIGPLGNGFDYRKPKTKNRKPILVGGGHGVAPLLELARRLRNKRNTSVFIGARTKAHVVCDGGFRKLKVKTYVATEDGSKGYKGLVTELIKKKLKTKSAIFACGPKAMLKAVAGLAANEKIPCQVSLEEYMGCGIGTCRGCAVYTISGYKMVCKDGPIFDAEEIVW